MARMIDADRLLRELTALSHGQVWPGWTYDGIRLLIERQPTLTQPNEWVSVENALPPEHEPVLCIVSGNPNPNITLDDAYQLGSWNKADGWIIDEWLDWEGANVTWWMKLPEPPDCRPPEGEEEENDVIEITENL